MIHNADVVRLALCLLCGILVGAFARGQSSSDLDGDGMNDSLEVALANRFAPEWRFAKWQAGDGSDQNNNEIAYPISVQEWFDQIVSAGDYPQLLFQDPDDFMNYEFEDILDINGLSMMVNPFTLLPVSEQDDGSEEYVKIYNYPSGMTGDPDDFPTYFRCFPESFGNGIARLSFQLFYAYDEKGAPFDAAEHRADWSGINILLSGMSDLTDPASVAEAQIEHVWYGGHGTKRFIYPYSTSYSHLGDHPMVFVSRGSHTCFPHAGEWHDYYVTGFGVPYVDTFDDMFPGNGLVVQSWDPTRALINLGELPDTTGCDECLPLVGWLTYVGQWGPDGNPGGASSSPPGPPWKGEWNGSLVGAMFWEQLVGLNLSYADPFEPLGTAHGDGWFNDTSEPAVVFWNTHAWDGPDWFTSGPQAYPDISLTGLIFGDVSTLFLGEVRVRLFTGLNFTGNETVFNKSSPNIGSGYQSMIVERLDGSFSCDQVVDYQNMGFENGTWPYPYNTVEEAVNAATPGQHICIRAGDYPVNFIGVNYINKHVIMHSYFGTAKVGD